MAGNLPHAVLRGAQRGKQREEAHHRGGVAGDARAVAAQHARDVRSGDERRDEHQHLIQRTEYEVFADARLAQGLLL